jgi:NADH dehydrogenase
MANSTIESVTADSVHLKNGKVIQGSAVIWTAGVQPSTLLKSIHGLPLTSRGKVPVDASLSVRGMQDIFAIGDIIEFIDPETEKPIPGLAYTAQAQGHIVAQNIIAEARGSKLHPYNPSYSTWIAPVGGKYAVAYLAGGSVSGLLGWLVRGFVDFRYFASILPFKEAFKLFRKDLMLFSRND